MRRLVIFGGLVLAGCGGGEATRWISAEGKAVTVEGIPYQVNWVRDGNGIDMRGLRAQAIVIMPDQMIERRRNTEAAKIVGSELCGGLATVIAEAKDGDLYTTRMKCG